MPVPRFKHSSFSHFVTTAASYPKGPSAKKLYNLYTALTRLQIDYGSEFYHNTTQQCKNKLDLTQYKCLRICSGALKSTPIPILLITILLINIYNDIFKKHTNIRWQNYYANQNPFPNLQLRF